GQRRSLRHQVDRFCLVCQAIQSLRHSGLPEQRESPSFWLISREKALPNEQQRKVTQFLSALSCSARELIYSCKPSSHRWRVWDLQMALTLFGKRIWRVC